MALFKSRSQGPSPFATGSSDAAARAESIEALRRRARHRLIGAVVLVLLAVIGFPLLFDSQPRPVSVDVPIVIPDRAKSRPLALPSSPASAPATAAAREPASSPTVSGRAASEVAKVPAAASLDPREEVVATPKPKASQDRPATPAVAPASRPSATPARAASAGPGASGDGDRARALLEGREPAKSASAATDGARFVVQVGAYADEDKVRDVRARLERAGLKTYAQTVETKDGRRTRVRIGPFASRAEADKAAARIRGLDLAASVLAL